MNEEKKCSFSIYRVLLITALVVFLLLTFLQPWNSDIRPEAYKVLCMANLQYLNMAILEYTTGNNCILPESEKWCDLIADSNWIRPKTYICKGSNTVYCESSYAMNDNLSDFIITDITKDVVLLFETNSGIDPNGRTVRLDSREFYKIMEDRGFLKKMMQTN